MDTQYAESHLRLGAACLGQKQLDQAILEYQMALRLDPSIPHGYCGLGNVYLENGELEKAMQTFENEVKIDPNCFLAHLYLHSIYLALGHSKDTLYEYKECLRTSEHPSFSGELGVVLTDEIVKWIQELAKRQNAKQFLKPLPYTVVQSYLSRANALANSDNIAEAIAVYTELIEKDPNHVLAYAYRAGC